MSVWPWAWANPSARPAMNRPTQPGRRIIAAVAAVVIIGTVLLWLPVAIEPGHERIGLFNALFTAVSATTGTGLLMVDTGATFSHFGEVVILALIQIGGMGIMTLASLTALVFTRRLGVAAGLTVGAAVGLGDYGEIRPLIGSIIRFSLLLEAIVAVVLTARFAADGYSLGGSLYLGVFHAISAFNNAGISPLDGGLIRYIGDPVMNLTIAVAIIVGGLGFPVVADITQRRRPIRAWTLHTKLTIAASAALLAVGFMAFIAIEWSNPATFGPLSIGEKLLAAFMQSAMTRTAGFNTVPIAELHHANWLLMLLLMTIGAGSASTGGGIKTSTFVAVVWTTLAEFRGDRENNIFHRRLPLALQRQALALVVVALGTIGTATFFLSLLHPEFTIEALLLEVVSAFSTTGLDTGTTRQLSDPAKVLIMILMFIGRIGPVTFGTVMLLRSRPQLFRYPEEKLLIG